jgi:hypothetical protein
MVSGRPQPCKNGLAEGCMDGETFALVRAVIRFQITSSCPVVP